VQELQQPERPQEQGQALALRRVPPLAPVQALLEQRTYHWRVVWNSCIRRTQGLLKGLMPLL
jgi:hypothetical protein